MNITATIMINDVIACGMMREASSVAVRFGRFHFLRLAVSSTIRSISIPPASARRLNNKSKSLYLFQNMILKKMIMTIMETAKNSAKVPPGSLSPLEYA